MPDPYSARGWPRVNTEMRSPLDQFIDRLRQLGATDEEVDDVLATWDDFDSDPHAPEAWTHAQRARVLAMGDNELRALIESGRQEYAYATTTEDEAAEQGARRARQRAATEAEDRINGNVAGILAWVGDDPVRATAVYSLEKASPSPRKTLLEPLEGILDGA